MVAAESCRVALIQRTGCWRTFPRETHCIFKCYPQAMERSPSNTASGKEWCPKLENWSYTETGGWPDLA